jgi:hypothetical protein
MPRELRQFVAHVSAFKVITNKWGKGDFSMTRCGVSYPDDIHSYVTKEFVRLKRAQYVLLNSDRWGVPGLGRVLRKNMDWHELERQGDLLMKTDTPLSMEQKLESGLHRELLWAKM